MVNIFEIFVYIKNYSVLCIGNNIYKCLFKIMIFND